MAVCADPNISVVPALSRAKLGPQLTYQLRPMVMGPRFREDDILRYPASYFADSNTET
jgi:hypothetical protein